MTKYLTWGGAFEQAGLGLNKLEWYLWTLAFVAGNLVFPYLVHTIPQGGMIFLPIYFFTLIAAYRFGLVAGLVTAVLSPLANNLLTGMPPAPVLDAILVKSVALAVVAALAARSTKQLSLGGLAVVIVVYQVLGGTYEAFKFGAFEAALGDWKLGWPGLLIQLVGGGLVLGLFTLKKKA